MSIQYWWYALETDVLNISIGESCKLGPPFKYIRLEVTHEVDDFLVHHVGSAAIITGVASMMSLVRPSARSTTVSTMASLTMASIFWI